MMMMITMGLIINTTSLFSFTLILTSILSLSPLLIPFSSHPLSLSLNMSYFRSGSTRPASPPASNDVTPLAPLPPSSSFSSSFSFHLQSEKILSSPHTAIIRVL